MKKNYSMIVAIVAVILAVVCIWQNYLLRQDIAYLKSQMNQIENAVDVDMMNIRQEVQYTLKEMNSLLSASSWEYISADIENGTVDIACHVTPKEYSELTEAKIVCAGKEYPMEYKDGEYAAQITISVYEDTVVERVIFSEGENLHTEELSWGIAPRFDYLTLVYGHLDCIERDDKVVDGMYVWEMDALLHISVERKGTPVGVQSMALVEQIDGVEVGRTEIPLSTSISIEDNVHQYQYAFENAYEIPLGSEFCLYLEVVDGDNLYHRNVLELFDAVEENIENNADPVQVWNGAESEIYDAEGNKLFNIDWSRYK